MHDAAVVSCTERFPGEKAAVEASIGSKEAHWLTYSPRILFKSSFRTRLDVAELVLLDTMMQRDALSTKADK